MNIVDTSVNISDRVFHFVGSVGKFVSAGMNMAPSEVVEERIRICHGCDHYKGGFCEICTCLLAIKTQFPHETCPLPEPKWGPVAVSGAVSQNWVHQPVPVNQGGRCGGCGGGGSPLK